MLPPPDTGENRCSRCGSSLAGLHPTIPCPECGTGNPLRSRHARASIPRLLALGLAPPMFLVLVAAVMFGAVEWLIRHGASSWWFGLAITAAACALIHPPAVALKVFSERRTSGLDGLSRRPTLAVLGLILPLAAFAAHLAVALFAVHTFLSIFVGSAPMP